MKQDVHLFRNYNFFKMPITYLKSIKGIANTIWILALLLLPAVMMSQTKAPQEGDTTIYKTLIPETKQSLLKNMSMIANMRFAFRNEFQDGDHVGSRFT